ncbi:MAG: 4-(cytidine 5'-diphospho)-2-C-methyl-D-erythritol kinase [Candidatus Aminicenantes bacterium]|nr:4-(cytidine 5'-diphospho)-2-C-methyl-D-erythritol kinase [Candidatus Aminicenantes bacterium]
MRIKSFAKINLGLEVLSKREDGYHDIKTVFQSVDLFDVLRIARRDDSDIVLAGSEPSVPWDETNLVYRAARMLQQESGVRRGAEIYVEKNIPPGKGLGGGSSNAAITLWALSRLWELSEDKAGLLRLAARLGADVPYFLEGGLCLGTGRGDILAPLPDRLYRVCLLVLPSFPIPTAQVYGAMAAVLTSGGKAGKIDAFLRTDELRFLDNELEETIFRLFPQIKGIKSLIQSLGPELSLVSGSGSAVFGLFRERAAAEAAIETAGAKHTAVLVEFVSRGRYWAELNAGV